MDDGGAMWRVLLEHVDRLRAFTNTACVHLEAWQIASYTLSLVFLVLYIVEQSSSDLPLLERIRARVFSLLRTLPWVAKRIEEDLARAKKEIEEEIHECDVTRDFYKFLPERGLSKEDILTEAKQYSSLGAFRSRSRPAADVSGRKAQSDLLAEIFKEFGWTNPRDAAVFPGVRKMESEIVRMCCSLFHGGTDSCGVVAASSSEAILLVCASARSEAARRGIRVPSIVVPSSASPALFHAAKLLGMRVRKVPTRKDGTVDSVHMKRQIRSDTCMLFVSAPNHMTGSIDPIDGVAKIAQRYGIRLHVECSLGGFLLPFMEFCDYPAPSFDFRLPGVSSINIDLHKYGKSPSECSVLMYRDNSSLRSQVYVYPDWLGGIYATPTLSDSLDGVAVAVSWATLLATGREGFVDTTHRIVEATRRIASGLAEVQCVNILGSPDLSIVAFETDDPIDVYVMVELLRARGWPVESVASPAAARVIVNLEMSEFPVCDTFVEDVETFVTQLLNNPSLGEGSRMSAYHRMVQTAPDKWLLHELATQRALALYSMPPPAERRTTRTLSVEGRKMSMLHQGTDLQQRIKQEYNNK